MVLSLDADPPFKTYQCFGAHPLGIVGAVTDLAPLLASHYINFSCNSNPSDFSNGVIGATIVPRQTIGHFVASGQCDLFDVKDSSLFHLHRSTKLIQLLVDRIREGWYVLLHVNNYYFPGHQAHLEIDFLHDCLAFGFDTARSTFKVAMYLKTGTYGVTDVSFTDMAMALAIHGNGLFLGDSICYTSVALFVRPRKHLQFQFDRVAACSHLADYLRSAAPEERLYARDDLEYAGDWEMTFGYPTKHRSFGLKAFAGIASNIKTLIINGQIVDMRGTRALWEHKKIMYSNIKVWAIEAVALNAAKIIRLYAEVVDWTHDLHLLCFAFNQRVKNTDKLLRHFDMFLSIIEVEKEVLTEVYFHLSASRVGATSQAVKHASQSSDHQTETSTRDVRR